MGLVVSRPPSFRAARVTVPCRLVRRDSNPPSADRLVSPRNRFVSLTHANRSRPRSRAPVHTPRIAPRLTQRVRAPRLGRTLEPRA
jgi:hypothetical protein